MKVDALIKSIEEAERFLSAARKVEIIHDKFNNGKRRVSHDNL